MRNIAKLLRLQKQIRVVGFDDAPFCKGQTAPVNVSGIVCSNDKFEGMLWGEIECDGVDATQNLSNLLVNSKFHPQVSLILIDGIAMGGFNVIDLPLLAETTQRPCIAVMRKTPDMQAIKHALTNFEDAAQRMNLIHKAGKIHQLNGHTFQSAKIEPQVAAEVLDVLTVNGNVPEALRLAHLIGAAVKTGQSSNRA